MPVSYTNRKGMTYMLYRGRTRIGKPRYYFGRPGQSQGEPVTEIPSGYTISESVNGVLSLVKNRPALIQPEEVEAVAAAVQQHPDARRYRVAVKGKRIEVYEQVGPITTLWSAHYTSVLRFTLLDRKQRLFSVERMCYLGSIDGWLELHGQTGPMVKLARALIPTLGTEQFYELW
jgi:hypothetical protein